MQRIDSPPRPGWQKKVEAKGLIFHTTDEGNTYWDESAYYHFSRYQIDQIEKATYALNDICLQAIDQIIHQNLFADFNIPPQYVDWLKRSWAEDENTIYGRFDLLYDGTQPPKLAEYNADTPTALLEAGVIQWFWLQDLHPEEDQFNSIHERLIEAWQHYAEMVEDGEVVYFTSLEEHTEDVMTVNYQRDAAIQAGLKTEYLAIESLGWHAQRREFIDGRQRPIRHLFKLYPWEWMFQEEYGQHLLESRTKWLEPPWKVLLSNKALLPLLHEMFPDHPNLLAASWEPLQGCYVRKPVQGREGANIAVIDGGHEIISTDGEYGEQNVIYQEFFPTPRFNGRSIVIGSWFVNGYACGMGIREDESIITSNTSRFVPHLFG
jgi:glutathionylspermidine synthase